MGAVGAVGAGMRWSPLKTSETRSQWPRNVAKRGRKRWGLGNGLAGALKRGRGRPSNVAGKGGRWAVWAVGAVGAVGAGMRWSPLKTSEKR